MNLLNSETKAFLENIQDILKQYEGTPITLRQLYYRLVARGMANNKKSYQRLIQLSGKWRKEEIIPIDAFVDRAREIKDFRWGNFKHEPGNWLKGNLENIIQDMTDRLERYNLALWYGQEKRVFVGVEKNALVGVFEPVCREYNVTLLPCVGYPSLSFLKQFSKLLSSYESNDGLGHNMDIEESEPINYFLYFGDWDPSGLNIPEAINNNMDEVPSLSQNGASNYTYKHIALEPEFIEKYNLIPAPAKETDSRHDRFVEEHGKNVYELDALDPKVLQELIKNTIIAHIDGDTLTKRREKIDEGRKVINEYIEKLNVKSAVETIRKAIETLNEGSDKDE